MAQVGIERAFSGSECMTNGRLVTVSVGRFPIPYKNAECPSKPSLVPNAHVAANANAIPPATNLGVLPYFDPFSL